MWYASAFSRQCGQKGEYSEGTRSGSLANVGSVSVCSLLRMYSFSLVRLLSGGGNALLLSLDIVKYSANVTVAMSKGFSKGPKA